MRVLLEGIFPLHMEQLLEYVVEIAGLMTLDEINSRIAAFSYAYFNEKPAGAYVINPLTEYLCIYRSSISCYHLFNAVHHGNPGLKYVLSKYDLSVYCHYMN